MQPHCTIPLTQGQFATVDPADFEELSQHKWCAWRHRRTWYAVRAVQRDGKSITIRMHNVIMGAKGIDHIDGNGLNNTRANLRLATPGQNVFNRDKPSSNTSGYKGVHWYEARRKWQAYIQVEGKRKHLGYHPTAEEAAIAYDIAARELHGEYARLNFPPPWVRHHRS